MDNMSESYYVGTNLSDYIEDLPFVIHEDFEEPSYESEDNFHKTQVTNFKSKIKK